MTEGTSFRWLTKKEFVELSPPELTAVLHKNRRIKRFSTFTRMNKYLSKTAFITKIKIMIDSGKDLNMDFIEILDSNLSLHLSLPIIDHIFEVKGLSYCQDLAWWSVTSVDIIHKLLEKGMNPGFIRWGAIRPLRRVSELKYVGHAAEAKVLRGHLGIDDKTAYSMLGIDFGGFIYEDKWQAAMDIITYGVKKTSGIWAVDMYDNNISNLSARVRSVLQGDWIVVCFKELNRFEDTIRRIIETFLEYKVIYLVFDYYSDKSTRVNLNFLSIISKMIPSEKLVSLVKEHREYNPAKYDLWERFKRMNTIGW